MALGQRPRPAPLLSHGPARPPPLVPARAGPEGIGSVEPAAGSVTTLSGTAFAAAGDGRKGTVEPVGKADVSLVGGGDSIAVSIGTSFVLERPESRYEQRHGPRARGVPGRVCPHRPCAPGSERSLPCLATKRDTPGPRNSEPCSKLP